MNRILPVLLILLITLMACQPRERVMKDAERDAMIDSLIAIKMEEISKQSAEDLDRRMSIEVKAKSDSIVAAIKDSIIRKTSPPDNTIPNNLPMP